MRRRFLQGEQSIAVRIVDVVIVDVPRLGKTHRGQVSRTPASFSVRRFFHFSLPGVKRTLAARRVDVASPSAEEKEKATRTRRKKNRIAIHAASPLNGKSLISRASETNAGKDVEVCAYGNMAQRKWKNRPIGEEKRKECGKKLIEKKKKIEEIRVALRDVECLKHSILFSSTSASLIPSVLAIRNLVANHEVCTPGHSKRGLRLVSWQT